MPNLLTRPTTVSFIAPPLGLEPRTDFVFAPIAQEQGLYSLTHEGGVRVRVLDASARLPEYAAAEADAYFRVVDALSPDEVTVLVILAATGGQVTANLDAPVVVNNRTGITQQVVHRGELTRLRVPLREILS